MNVLFKNYRTAHEQMEYPFILALRGKEIKIYKYIFKLWFDQMNIEEYYFIPIVCIENEPLFDLEHCINCLLFGKCAYLTVNINCTIHNRNIL